MKNFEIYNGILYSESLIKIWGRDRMSEYLDESNKWIRRKWIMRHKLHPVLGTKIKETMNKVIQDLDVIRTNTIRKNNQDRMNGVSFEERKNNIEKIDWLTEKRKKLLNLKLRPIEEWESPDVWRNIEDYGLDWFIRTFYQQICLTE